MKIAFLTESRADWGGIWPVLAEAYRRNISNELWICGEHLEKGTFDEIKEDMARVDKRFFKESFFLTNPGIVRKIIAESCSTHKEQVKAERTNKPDVLVVLGDRENVLYYTMAAWKEGIKIAHISGGDKQSGRLIDEPVRDCISRFADIHFPCTERSAKRLVFDHLSKSEESVHLVGSPYIDDIAMYFRPTKEEPTKDFYLVLMNPCGKKLGLNRVLDAIADEKVFLIDSNNDNGGLCGIDFSDYKNIKFVANLPRMKFLDAMWNSKAFIGNSSALFLEAQYLGVPCIHVGDRNLGREEAFPGHCIHWNEYEHIVNALFNTKDARTSGSSVYRGCRMDFSNGAHGDGSASKKIIDILEGLSCE